MYLVTHRIAAVILLALSLGGGGWNSAIAAVSSPTLLVQAEPDKKTPTADEGKPRLLKEQLIQPADSELKPFRPAKPRTAEDKNNIEALTWFAVGRMHQKRGEFQKALQAFQKASKSDPDSIAILEAIIPLSLTLNRTDEAIKYAQQAIKISPGHYKLLRLLGRQYVAQGQLPAAIKMFEQAGAAADLDKHSVDYVEVQRILGILYRAAGQLKKSAAAFEVVFTAIEDPDAYGLDFRLQKQMMSDVATNYEQLGNAFYEGGRFDLAIKSYLRALETKTGNAGNVGYNLARAYLETKQPDLAMTELQKYFKAQRQSKGRDAYLLLAVILKAQGKPDELLPQLQTLAEKDRRNSTLQFFYAEALLKADELDKAEIVLNETLKKNAEPEGFAVLAGIYRKQNRPDELLNSLARAYAVRSSLKSVAGELKAIGENPELFESVLAAGRKLEGDQLDFAHAYVLANLALNAEKSDVAEEYFRTALTKTRVPEQKNSAYLALSEVLRVGQKFPEAAQVLREATDDPTFIGDVQKRIFFYYHLSFILELGGDTKAAIEAITTGMKQVGKPLGDLKLREAWIYSHSKQYDESIKVFDQIIKDFAKDPRILRLAKSSLSNLYVQKGDIRKGEEILEEIFKVHPDDPGVNNDLGYLYADQGKNLEQAEAMIRKALKSEPENAAFLDSIGWVLYKREKYAEALPYLEKAAGMQSGQDGTIFDHLGDVHQQLKQPEKAKEAWTKALKLVEEGIQKNEKLIGQLKGKLGIPKTP